MVKILQCSDLHEQNAKVDKFQTIMDLAQKDGIEKVVVCGDLVDGKKALSELRKTNSKIDWEPFVKKHNELVKKVGEIKSEEQYLQALKPLLPEIQPHIIEQAQAFETAYSEIYQGYKQVCESHPNVSADFILGNHDTAHAAQALEDRLKQGIWEFKGMKFYAPPKTTQTEFYSLAGMQDQREGLDWTTGFPEELAGIAQIVLQQLFPHVGGQMFPLQQLRQVPEEKLEEMLKDSPFVSGEYKDDEYAFIFTHEAGPGDEFVAKGHSNGLDAETYYLLKKGRAKNIGYGHLHHPMFDTIKEEANEYLGLRTSPDYLYVMDVDESTGKVRYVDVYQLIRA